MKKALVCLAVLIALGSARAFAATTQFTETLPPASPQGGVPISNGYSWSLTSNSQGLSPLMTLPVGTSVYFQTLIPSTTGQLGFCTTCINGNASKGLVCVSTGVAAGQFVAIGSFTATTGCQ